jgi:heat shock protein HslJ
MPERWRHEVKKLGGLEPSDEVWRRAEQGPRTQVGPSLPPRRQRIVTGIVAFVVFLAAGGFAWRALRPADDRSVGSDLNPTIVVTLKILDTGGVSIPTATLRAAGRTILGKGTTVGWQSANSDEAAPHFTDGSFVRLKSGSLLEAAGDAESVDAELQQPGTFPFRPVVSFGQLSDAVVLDQPFGRYVLRLTGHWLQGNATFYFPIDLGDQGIVSPPDADEATLTFVGKNAPTATLTYGDGHQDGSRTYYTWCDGSRTCVEGFADYATYPPPVDFLPIPAGTLLLIGGDATALTGILRRDGLGENGAVDLDENVIPTIPGRYVLQLDVAFDRGDATFFLGIEATSTGSSGSQLPAASELDGSAWQLAAINGTPLPTDARPLTLEFSRLRLGGIDGCNEYGGPYRVDGASIQVGELVGTLMSCSGEGTNERADGLWEGLKHATSFDLTADHLTITSPTTTLTFEPASTP